MVYNSNHTKRRSYYTKNIKAISSVNNLLSQFGLILLLTWGWPDLNRRSPAPEAGILTKLDNSPNTKSNLLRPIIRYYVSFQNITGASAVKHRLTLIHRESEISSIFHNCAVFLSELCICPSLISRQTIFAAIGNEPVAPGEL
jgi:hypothetical protein